MPISLDQTLTAATSKTVHDVWKLINGSIPGHGTIKYIIDRARLINSHVNSYSRPNEFNHIHVNSYFGPPPDIFIILVHPVCKIVFSALGSGAFLEHPL